MHARIAALWIYPVKSLAGIPLDRAEATLHGLRHDRQWTVLKADGHVLTQRQEPRMALITPQLSDLGLNLHHPRCGTIHVPRPHTGDSHAVPVWKDWVQARDAGNDVANWLSEALEQDGLRLSCIAEEHSRHYLNPQRFGIAGQYFSDAAPYLVSNTASLEALNSTLRAAGKAAVDMRHFRANVVIEGPPAFAEQQIAALLMKDGSRLELVDPCQRCSMITVDPQRGAFLPGAHPFAALAALNAMPDNPKAPAFGMNARWLGSGTTSSPLQVGDTVQLDVC